MRTLTLLPAGVYDVLVSDVHDGDTIRVLVPVEVKVRLAGIQAPELSTPRGKDVAAWLKAKLKGQWAELELLGPYKYGDERMGRVKVGGVDVGAELVDTGRAVPWDGHGPRPAG